MLRAMCSQVPGFKKYMSEAHMKGIQFAFFSGKSNIGLEEFDMTLGSDTYRISPIIEGGKKCRSTSGSDRCSGAGRCFFLQLVPVLLHGGRQ
ncbi:Phage-related protein, tail component [Citrobacter freundii]|nr:Phage-related protein, tail component [Citrobacter freundii]